MTTPEPSLRQIDGHIILVGLPGAGKSTVGRALARKLGRPFLDFDLEIERRTGLPIQRIFAELGERTFRKMEIDLTRELAAAPPMVLSPGGGWVTNEGVFEILRPPGRIIHLKISPDGAFRRISRSKVVRPLLLNEDPGSVLSTLWERRAHLYESADSVLDVELLSSEEVTERLVGLAYQT